MIISLITYEVIEPCRWKSLFEANSLLINGIRQSFHDSPFRNHAWPHQCRLLRNLQLHSLENLRHQWWYCLLPIQTFHLHPPSRNQNKVSSSEWIILVFRNFLLQDILQSCRPSRLGKSHRRDMHRGSRDIRWSLFFPIHLRMWGQPQALDLLGGRLMVSNEIAYIRASIIVFSLLRQYIKSFGLPFCILAIQCWQLSKITDARFTRFQILDNKFRHLLRLRRNL